MPHKHTRRKDGDSSNFDIAPSRIAKPLPAFSKTTQAKGKPNTQRPKRRPTATKSYKEDDTPRAFSRLMQYHNTKKRPSGLDDGSDRRGKKRKSNATEKETAVAVPAAPAVEVPKIMPGERLADYSARVDQALPIGGLARKGKVKVEGIKERRTKTEKRLHKMYDSWREEEARRKEKLEEQQEQEEEEEDERDAEMGGKPAPLLPDGRKAKRRRMIGEKADDDGDPWAVLKTRRDAPKGLHDVVQAPPSFKAVPKEKFKVRNGAKVDVANIPTAAGSLKRREELSDARRDVIERYRAIMKGSGGL